VGQWLKTKQIQALYSSDLSRAKETAELISRAINLKIEPYRPDLREIDFGCWEGHTLAEVARLYPEQLARWRSDRTYLAPHGGETFAQLAARGWQALKEIAASNPGRKVAVVTHGGLIKAALCLAHGLGFQRRSEFTVDNTAVNTIRL